MASNIKDILMTGIVDHMTEEFLVKYIRRDDVIQVNERIRYGFLANKKKAFIRVAYRSGDNIVVRLVVGNNSGMGLAFTIHADDVDDALLKEITDAFKATVEQAA